MADKILNFIKKLVPQSIKNIYHLAQAVLANFLFGSPAKSIKIIGVTGTNGKTTTVQMIAKILEEAGKKVAVISTINFKLGEKEWVNKTKFTTLSSFSVQKFILDAVKARCEYLVLETSSHSLDQYRVWGVDCKTAVITNVTREHLDYHKTMDEYRAAKMLLFKKAKTAIVNLDMENAKDFLQFNNEKKLTYSLKNNQADIFAENIQLGINKSSFAIKGRPFVINIPGEFNIENALAATCAGLAEGIDLKTIVEALEKIKNIPGRLEYVPNNRGINIMIDYAVTPDSLEKLYALIQKANIKKAKIIAVFGACGERDRGKRPIMGEIVSRFADQLIITNEDPYGENPVQIINEVFSGVVGQDVNNEISNFKSNSNNQISKVQKIENVNCWRILDRREAVKKALRMARPGDFVIVTGKGAEETMAIGNKRILWNDKKVIRELLRELK